MSVIEKAVEFMLSIANDSSHGYDQSNRWGPDYDCSSLVITSYKKAGLPLTATYTGNMYNNFIANGFEDVTKKVNFSTGAGMQRGDVLLNHVQHTAMHIGNGKIVHAAGNENGGITGGKTGDQTGREIYTLNYYNHPWNCVLRYTKEENKNNTTTATKEPASSGSYIVQKGDSLWKIAADILGSGMKYKEIMKANNMKNQMIQPGQTLIIPGFKKEEKEVKAEKTVKVLLPELSFGCNGMPVRSLQTLLVFRSCLSQSNVNGDFDSATQSAVKKFQTSAKIAVDGIVGENTWKALLS